MLAFTIGLTAVLAPARSPLAMKALSTVSSHPIVQRNPYCEWFAQGTANEAEVRDLVVQFSVFSNLFLLAQLNKVINAPTIEGAREGKEILANEIGVAFKPKGKRNDANSAQASKDLSSPEFVSVEGSIEGGVYSHRAAHFEWLCDVGKSMGLTFDQMGKRRHGSPATLHFCDALFDIYGADDPSTSVGASFAIEHWANAGFWDQLVEGFEKLNANMPAGKKKYPMGFWRFHQMLEAQHAAHTMDELEEAVEAGLIEDEAKFVAAANEMLDACAVFWDGLEASRKGDVLVLEPEGRSATHKIDETWSVGIRRPVAPLHHRASEPWMNLAQP